MRVHGLDAYTDGRKSRHGIWARIMSRGLVFVPAESAQAMNPSLTLEHNRRLLAPEERATIERRLETYFGLDFGAFARLYPDEVSGGELQRITLMILLSRRGDLVLLDEPTVNLDRNLRRRFIEFLNSEILPARDKTVLMASHDLDFIHSLKLERRVCPGGRPTGAPRGGAARQRLRQADRAEDRAAPASRWKGCHRATSRGAFSASAPSRPSRVCPSGSTVRPSTASPARRAAASPA